MCGAWFDEYQRLMRDSQHSVFLTWPFLADGFLLPRNSRAAVRIVFSTEETIMENYTELRQQIAQDLDTLSRAESPKSIFEIADDYLLGNPSLKRELVEDIIKEEADKRNIPIH